MSSPLRTRPTARAVRLALAIFLLVCAWATTHLDETTGHHEGASHSAITVGSLADTGSGETPDATTVPPVQAEAATAAVFDGATVLVLLFTAALFFGADRLEPLAARRGHTLLGAPPPRRSLLITLRVSRI